VNDDVLIRAEHVSKKFCRSLKRSLWYGAKDVARSLVPWSTPYEPDHNETSGEFHLPPLREDEFWAVRDVSFEVRRGECLGLIGHNGAGKSTLLKMLNSLNRPDAGRITMRGRVGALIELSAGFNPILTGRENIYNQASLLGFSRQETDAKFDAIVDFSELEDFLDMPIQNYSSGMRVKLGFAVASQLEPDILLVDEVLAVGDAGFRFKCLNRMADLMKNCAVIFVSHSMPQIFRVCNCILLLEDGRSIFKGGQVAEGVARYFSKFDTSKKLIVGSMEAEIEKIELKSGNKSIMEGEMLELQYGDSLFIRTNIKFSDGIERVKLHFAFWSTDLLPVMNLLGPDLSGYDVYPDSNGFASISLTIPKICLNQGNYSITAVLNSYDTKKIYYSHDSIARINVCAGTMSGSYVLQVPEWHCHID
jgi:lipopolysaccharide transport system ATP-binding protein